MSFHDYYYSYGRESYKTLNSFSRKQKNVYCNDYYCLSYFTRWFLIFSFLGMGEKAVTTLIFISCSSKCSNIFTIKSFSVLYPLWLFHGYKIKFSLYLALYPYSWFGNGLWDFLLGLWYIEYQSKTLIVDILAGLAQLNCEH